jgi:3-oxoacyl-[acyl-carrier protein] reductase
MTLVVISGGAHGIGRAAAESFAARGCTVAILGRRQDDLEIVADSIRARRGPAVAYVCDVSDDVAVERVAASILRDHGPAEVVVNNAGVVARSLVEETTTESWDHVLGVNLRGPFLLTRAFLPAMKQAGRGRIVNVSSISATLGTPRLSAYCASKWGLVGFTKALAEELRGTGLQAVAILPGSVDTAMLRGSGFAPQMSPADVAGTIVYAALDAPAAINGSAIEVFGP